MRKHTGTSILLFTLLTATTLAAPVGSPVVISESGIPGAMNSTKGVDQLSGQYDEVFTATSTSNFFTEAVFKAGSWFKNGGVVPTQLNAPQQLGQNQFSFGYGLYAKFSSAGTYLNNPNGFTFTGGNAYLELWVDPDQNTDYRVKTSAIGSVNNLDLASGAGSDTDDILLGSASVLLAGEGAGVAGLANGNFEMIFGNWSLTKAGSGYFVTPNPFYLVIDLNGNFQNFMPVSGSSIQLMNNSANAFFVPEPGILLLTGIGLAGLMVRRKRQTRLG
ncbi:flocculation-associated PEP-CTERM protein PepA [Chitinimonas naiadis]